MKGQDKKAPDWWDIPTINNMAKERMGYQTQKPEALLQRIIESSCPPGGVVLDPFCGCGTSVVVAERNSREWKGIDITHLAVTLMKHRLQREFGPTVGFAVVGEPTTADDAAILARDDPYQFQLWALGLVGARPDAVQRGADAGIDGRLYFHDEDLGGDTKQIVISVKGGRNVGVAMVRDLGHILNREHAEIGVLLSMAEPTQPMRAEAAGAGFYKSPLTDSRHPKLQILTVAQLLAGLGIDYPRGIAQNVSFDRRATRQQRQQAESLFDDAE